MGDLSLWEGESPKKFETRFGYLLSLFIASKIYDQAPRPLGVGKNSPKRNFFWGEAPPQGVHKFDVMTHYHL